MYSLNDYVAFVPNVLSAEECDNIINWYNDNLDKEFRSLTGDSDSKSVSHIRTSNSIMVPLKSKIDLILATAINKTILAYIQTIDTKYKLKDGRSWTRNLPEKLKSEIFIINRYDKDQEYKWHIDRGYDGYSEEDHPARHREFSVVIYLNDNFEGGETEFQFTSVKPQKGACLIFPSNFMYSHCARPVKNGVKYSCASWLAPLIEEDV